MQTSSSANGSESCGAKDARRGAGALGERGVLQRDSASGWVEKKYFTINILFNYFYTTFFRTNNGKVYIGKFYLSLLTKNLYHRKNVVTLVTKYLDITST